MLIEHQQIRKVFKTNCNEQIAQMRNIQQKLSQTNDLSIQNQATPEGLEEIQRFMQRWMELTAENQVLIGKYQKECRIGQLKIKEYQSLEHALATQLYIRDCIERQPKLREIYKQQQFIMWNALQQVSINSRKYNFRPLFVIA